MINEGFASCWCRHPKGKHHDLYCWACRHSVVKLFDPRHEYRPIHELRVQRRGYA